MRWLGLAVSLAAALAPIDAVAQPQGTAALTIGVASYGERYAQWDEPLFQLGSRGDLLFGRSSNADVGAGPYLEVLTLGFEDFQFGGGGSLLLPVIDYLPIVVSAGAYGRISEEPFEGTTVEPGVTGQVFWGTRSFNFHSAYVMSAGLLLQARVGLGDSRELAFVVGAQLDGLAISLPFLFVVNALRPGSPDTREIEPAD